MGSNEAKIIAGLMKQINIKLKKSLRKAFNNHDLTLPQLSVLTLINRNGDMRISDISRMTGLTNSTTSGIIDRLERMGLVKRVRSQKDRRVIKVAFSEKASDFTKNLEASIEDSFGELFTKVPEEDLKEIISGLNKFNTILNDINMDIEGEKI